MSMDEHLPASQAQELTRADCRPLIEIELELDPTVNFAMQQNDVPVVKALRIINQGEAEAPDLLVSAWVEPEFAAPWQTRVASVAPKGTYNLGTIPLELSPGWLVQLTERVVGAVHVEVKSGERVLARKSGRIEVLAYDEWSGLRSLPEILAAFVLPNHPAVEKLLAGAAELLGKWTGDSSLSGYQGKSPERVLQMTAAIYATLQGQGINYINPPASFEQCGQKIRLPDRILENKLGTCLDLAVLVAACLEQAGLFPLVAITKGHAFGGVWLEEECFADSATDDALRLRKRVDLGEICVFETTLLTGQTPASFDQAVQAARRHLEDDSGFRCVIDIRRSRKSRIRPLPTRVAGGVVDIAAVPKPGKSEPSGSTLPPHIPVINQPGATSIPATQAEAQETPATRLDRWKRKLLDLTLRNRLLNFRETKKTLPILCPDLASLENALAEGEKFQIHPRLTDMVEGHLRSAELHRQRTGQDPLEEMLKAEFAARRLHADVTKMELERRMLETYREARTSLEEGGANTLFVALGFLVWYETKTSDQRRIAPIILIPVELERRSVQEGFRVRQGDDEPRINTTLLEMLVKDFELRIPVPDPIPHDEHGIDVRGILTTFKQAIKEIDRWEVIEQAQIGLFSFTKYLMWRDLQSRMGDLEKNRVVSHLIYHPTEPFPVDGAFPDPDQLDQTYKPEETFCPLSSDSSQLAAVYAAAEGQSFVLEGPPGTGKSQTITNLIAHCMANGKTVLFVSEKIAALNVVHSRLKQVGLEPFCLELHSNKSHKMEVIQQLGRALEHVEACSSEAWQREANRLAAMRAELNAYVHSLHRIHRTGESVFQATSRLIGLRDVEQVDLAWPSSDAIDRDGLDRLREVVGKMQVAGDACGHPAGHVWSAALCETWSPALQREVEAAIKRLTECCTRLAATVKVAGPVLELGQGAFSQRGYDFIDRLAYLMLESPAPPAALLTEPDWKTIQASIDEWVRHGRRRDSLRQELYGRYTEGLLQLDLDALAQRLAKSDSSWIIPRWWGRRSVYGVLARASHQGQALARDALGSDLEKAKALRDEEHILISAGERAKGLLGRFWNDGEADWATVEKLRDWSGRLRAMAGSGAGSNPDRPAAYCARWARLATEGHSQLRPDGPVGQVLVAYCQAWTQFKEARRALEAKLMLDAELAWGTKTQSGLLDRMQTRLQQWGHHLSELHGWCNWRAVRHEAVDLKLQTLVDNYEQKGRPTAELMRLFDRGFYQWWIEAATEADSALREFFSPQFEHKIQQFREIDDRYTNLTRSEIQARLAARVPVAGNRVSENSEMGILRYQLQRKRAHTPIRQLFQKIPNLLPRLKPCLLMSPISVAQYLDAAHPSFDLVVFDEASQIPVWDAVGAIARGSEAVVVGDPKQLPPTNFFSRADEQELGDDDLVEDLESILDDCIAAQLPWLQLRWHYRSRHESLIAFSNYHYYDNRLLTFPSPHRDMGVSVRPVVGTYDKGKSRTNRTEAESVVAEIARRLKTPDLSRHSIGVVTFSIAQQVLVEDLLEDVRRQNPEIEPFFGPDATEAVFVKNLENVQGDERDVILFSVCYGPDEQGRVSMNFGPLNRDGGERRLNVAITRARREVVVFSTLKAEQIDLARTRARGVQHLKAFLDYAERGPIAIAEMLSVRAGDDFDSPFEKLVCEGLRQRGYEVHAQVGCSGYRIDLAVVDPESAGRYLLGIECDGANYHRAKTARDRDRLREIILNDLGWKLHRVWSTDWWANPQREMERIEAAIELARKSRSPVPRKEIHEQELIATAPPVGAIKTVPVVKTQTASVGKAIANAGPPVYQPFPIGKILGDLVSFYQSSSDVAIRRLIEAVVKQEGPISLALAARRVAAHWGLSRVTSNIQDRIRTVARQADVHCSQHGKDTFFWPNRLDQTTWRAYRVPGEDEISRREARDLPPEEIANAALAVLEQQVSLPAADLMRETGRLFGFQRMGQTVEKCMSEGIGLLFKSGKASEQEGMIVPRSYEC